MIGTSAPAPQALDHLDAADAGQAEVEHDDVGVVTGREIERLLAGVGQIRMYCVYLTVRYCYLSYFTSSKGCLTDV